MAQTTQNASFGPDFVATAFKPSSRRVYRILQAINIIKHQ